MQIEAEENADEGVDLRIVPVSPVAGGVLVEPDRSEQGRMLRAAGMAQAAAHAKKLGEVERQGHGVVKPLKAVQPAP
jgi:hypothetical protein